MERQVVGQVLRVAPRDPDRAELLRIRDALRARGFDAQVTPLLSNPGAVTSEE